MTVQRSHLGRHGSEQKSAARGTAQLTSGKVNISSIERAGRMGLGTAAAAVAVVLLFLASSALAAAAPKRDPATGDPPRGALWPTTVTTVMMPYITSQFEARTVDDRPLVVPKGATNFALLGQYVEIPEDVVFTVEYSVRGAMHAVYELMGVEKAIPAIYHGLAHPQVAFAALRTALG